MNALAIKEDIGNSVITLTKRRAAKPATGSSEPLIPPPNQCMLTKMDAIFHTVRTKKISLSSLHAVVNLYLNKERQISLSALASHLGVTTAAVTSVADGMERLGFARRSTNNLDRRLTWISLTPRGIAFAQWLESMIDSGNRAFTTGTVTEAETSL